MGRSVAFNAFDAVDVLTSVWLARTSRAGRTVAFAVRVAVALTSGAGLAKTSSVARSVAIDGALDR